jgi:hypothetical protein
MVHASPSELFVKRADCATGLPLMIQDGSIGLDVKSTAVWATSIREIMG